jgi:hypothetical protein
MQKGVIAILKGEFLTNKGASKNWSYILFCTLLAIIMIASSHSAEKKVFRVAELHQEIKELRSEFVDSRKRLMQLKMESNIARLMKPRGIFTSDQPAIKIILEASE